MEAEFGGKTFLFYFLWTKGSTLPFQPWYRKQHAELRAGTLFLAKTGIFRLSSGNLLGLQKVLEGIKMEILLFAELGREQIKKGKKRKKVKKQAACGESGS